MQDAVLSLFYNVKYQSKYKQFLSRFTIQEEYNIQKT